MNNLFVLVCASIIKVILNQKENSKNEFQCQVNFVLHVAESLYNYTLMCTQYFNSISEEDTSYFHFVKLWYLYRELGNNIYCVNFRIGRI